MDQSVWLTRAYDQAGREVLKKSYEPALWALAISECQGDHGSAQAIYVKARVAQLLELMAAEAQANIRKADRDAKLRQEKADRLAQERQQEETRKVQRDKEFDEKFFNAGRRLRALMKRLAAR